MTNISVYFASRFDKIKEVAGGFEYCRGSRLMLALRYKDAFSFEAVVNKALKRIPPSEQYLHIDRFSIDGVDESVFSRRMALEIEKSMSSTKRKLLLGIETEEYFQSLLADHLFGEREVQTPSGFIDVLTNEYIIEVKNCIDWKYAIGQLLVYSAYYPSRTKMLYIFGEETEKYRKLIDYHCSNLGIEAKYSNDVNDTEWLLHYKDYCISFDVELSEYSSLLPSENELTCSLNDFLASKIIKELGVSVDA